LLGRIKKNEDNEDKHITNLSFFFWCINLKHIRRKKNNNNIYFYIYKKKKKQEYIFLFQNLNICTINNDIDGMIKGIIHIIKKIYFIIYI